MRRTLRLEPPHDVALTLRSVIGPSGLTGRVGSGEWWRATRTPDGPASIHLRQVEDRLEAKAWGSGAAWALETLPELVGCEDRVGFAWPHDPVRRLGLRFEGLRVPRTRALFESLVPTVLAQKVTGKEAASGFLRLVRHLAEPAPGPVDLTLPPAPEAIAAMGYEEFHPLGIEKKRADILRRLARRVRRVEEAVSMPLADAYRRLLAFRGVGPWTAGRVGYAVFGDADAVEVGDYNLPSYVAWNLAGEARADDARMLELLAPYAPQRGRVVRLLQHGGRKPPRFGPRRAIRRIDHI